MGIDKPHKGRSATIIIASSTSKNINQADYVCDGVDDHIQINAAINTLSGLGAVDVKGNTEGTTKNQGGEILLLEGAFNITAPIVLSGKHNISISGMGSSTVINNLSTNGSHAIQCINESGSTSNRLTIKDILIKGNTDSGDGIHFENTNYETIENIFSQEHGANGLYIKAVDENHGADNKTISDSQFLFNDLHGISLDAIHDTLITSCHMEENDDAGIKYINTYNTIITGCNIEDNYGTYQVLATNAHWNQITGTCIEGSVSIGTGDSNNFFMDNCQIDNYLVLAAGTNNNLQINNCACAYLTISSTSYCKTKISNSELGMLGSITAYQLNINNSSFTYHSAAIITVTKALLNNNTITPVTGAQHIVAENLIISNSDFIGNNTLTINHIASSGIKTIISNCTSYQTNITVNGAAGNNQRTILEGNSFRLSGATVTLTNAHIVVIGNIIAGAGGLTINGADAANINGNHFLTLAAATVTLTLNNACVAPLLFATNTIKTAANFTLTDNSGLLEVAHNVNYS